MTTISTTRLVTDAAEWEALFARVAHPHMTQSWAYGEAKQAAAGREARWRVFDVGGWRARRLVFEREGRPVAICQVLDKSLAGVRWSSRLNRGPLFLDADPGAEVVREVYSALRRRWRHLHGVLVLAPALEANAENHSLLADLGFRDRHVKGWVSPRVDLRPDEEHLRKNLATTWGKHLRRAERSGMTLRVSSAPEDVDWMIRRHVENMREKDYVGPPPALVRALYEAVPGDFFVFQAWLEGEAIAGMAVYRFGNTAESYVGRFGSPGGKTYASNFLYWNAIVEMRRRGCFWFDLGGQREGATAVFKAGLRGEVYTLLNEWLAY